MIIITLSFLLNCPKQLTVIKRSNPHRYTHTHSLRKNSPSSKALAEAQPGWEKDYPGYHNLSHPLATGQNPRQTVLANCARNCAEIVLCAFFWCCSGWSFEHDSFVLYRSPSRKTAVLICREPAAERKREEIMP